MPGSQGRPICLLGQAIAGWREGVQEQGPRVPVVISRFLVPVAVHGVRQARRRQACPRKTRSVALMQPSVFKTLSLFLLA